MTRKGGLSGVPGQLKNISIMHRILLIHHISYMIVAKVFTIKISISWNMGSNQAHSLKKRFYQVKVKTLEVSILWKLGQRMDRA